jgi:tetratricopeptide (TPR) repeat protein
VVALYERRPGRDSLEHVGARAALAEILFQRQGDGDSARAVAIQREVVARRRHLLRPGHPAIGRALNDLAAYVSQVGDYAEAERLFRQAIAIHTKVSGADGASALNSRMELAPILSELGRYDEALAELEAVAAAWKRRSGPTSWAYCNAVNKIGFTLYQRGRAGEAIPWFGEALGVFRSRLGAEHPDTLSVWNNYGGAMAESGDLAGAERELVQVVAIKRRTGYKLATSLNLLGRTLRRKGDPAGALALHREAFAIVSGEVGADSVDAVVGRYLAGLALLELGRFDEAAAEIEAALAVDRAKRPAGHTRTGEDLTALARARLGQGRHAEAEKLAREGVAVQVSAVGADNGKTGEARLVLGEALLAAGRPADARREIAAAQPILEGAGPAYRAQLERARRLR